MQDDLTFFDNFRYRRVDSEPAHPGKMQDSSGGWWELDQDFVTPELFGAAADYDASVSSSLWTDNSAAFAKALQCLNAGVVRRLELRQDADYFLGDYSGSTSTSVFGTDILTGLTGTIAGSNTRLLVSSDKNAIHNLFVFQAVHDLTIEGITVTELNADGWGGSSATAPQGFRAFVILGNDIPTTRITFRDCRGEGLLTVFQVFNNSPNDARVSGIRFEGNCGGRGVYYGLGCQENGDNVAGTLTFDEVNRAVIVYGVRHHRLRVFVRHQDNEATGPQFGSNGLIKIVRKLADTVDIAVDLHLQGSQDSLRPVSIEHQNGSDDALIDEIDLRIYIDENLASPGSGPIVQLSSYDGAGNAENTPLNEDASGLSPVTTKKRFGTIRIAGAFGPWAGAPFIQSDVVPFTPGMIKLSLPAELNPDAVKLEGFLIEQAPQEFVSEYTGNLNNAFFAVPLAAHRGLPLAICLEVFALAHDQSDPPKDDKHHVQRIWTHGKINGGGGTTGIGSDVSVENGSTSIGSDLTVTTSWGYNDRLHVALASASDYTDPLSYGRVRARIVSQRAF